MYATSTAFINELSKGSQRIVVRADVLSGGAVVATGLRVISGSVEVDATATTRRRFSCTVVDPTGVLVPSDGNDVLSPYGYEVRLWRGFNYLDGTADELVPLGTFRIASAKVSDQGAVKIDLTGFDRSRAVQRAHFEQPYSIAANTNYITAIQDLITNRIGAVMFSSITTAAVTPVLLFDQASDPWAAVTQMADSIGCEVFFDPTGVCVIRTQPNLSTSASVYTYVEGANSTLFSVENNLNDEPGYNGVVVDGEPPQGTPVHSVVYDADPASPTYYLGKYGKVPRFYKSQFITSQVQADDAAAAMLRRGKGGTEQLGFSAIPNPALEGGDVVSVVRASIGVNDLYLLQSFSIPLDVADSMSVTTQKRRTA